MNLLPKVDVHGLNSEEALLKVRTALPTLKERGFYSVYIIHGKGEGILRQKIRSALKSNFFITSFRAGKPEEGGDGVTVAYF